MKRIFALLSLLLSVFGFLYTRPFQRFLISAITH